MINTLVKFGIIADIHQDIIHDSSRRLQVFLDEAKKDSVDFIISLGDFCHPTDKNQGFINIWNSFAGGKHHTLGNHDMDSCDKTKALRFFDMKKSYYYFDKEDFRFIILDTNFINLDNQYFDYANGNFFKYPKERTNLSKHQLDWLSETITNTDKYIVLFSHASLKDARHGIQNSKELHKILDDENKRCGYQKIVASFNGHTHIDRNTVIDSINYIDINSASYQWLGPKYKTIRYSKELCDKHKSLSCVYPYADSIFAIVDIDSDGTLTIKGRTSEFVGPTLEDIGYDTEATGYSITPTISSRDISFKIK